MTTRFHAPENHILLGWGHVRHVGEGYSLKGRCSCGAVISGFHPSDGRAGWGTVDDLYSNFVAHRQAEGLEAGGRMPED